MIWVFTGCFRTNISVDLISSSGMKAFDVSVIQVASHYVCIWGIAVMGLKIIS